MIEWLPLLMFVFVCGMLMLGYPVAFTLAGSSLLFMGLGLAFGWLPGSLESYLGALPERIFGIERNEMLMTVPLFVFMGVMLERSRLAEDLLDAVSRLFGNLRGGLAIAVILVGMVLGASTAIVGATVVTLGLLAVPTMLKHRYSPSLASGVVTASGTLGQIIPPSIILILLADQLTNAVTVANANIAETAANSADTASDNFDSFAEQFEDDFDWEQLEATTEVATIDPVSVQDLFAGAMLPGLLLVLLYMGWVMLCAWRRPESAPIPAERSRVSLPQFLAALLPPLALIVLILGSILLGWAKLSAAAGLGAVGATVIAASKGRLSWRTLFAVSQSTVKVTAMVFMILIAAQFFSLIFRGYGGDEMIEQALANLPGGVFTAMLAVMIAIFLLGFVLDFFEITFIVVPLVGPVLLSMGLDPIWLGVMIAMNLQTSFLTPPFGFALFYYRGIAPKAVTTRHIYRGVLPFIAIQIAMLVLLALWPQLVTWLPAYMA